MVLQHIAAALRERTLSLSGRGPPVPVTTLQHSPTGARLVEEVPAVTCPAPVSAGAAALLELEGDGSTERLEPPRPAAAAGGARGTRHARPDPLH